MKRTAPVCVALTIALASPGIPADAATTATASEVWLTTADASKLLARQADVQFGTTPGSTIIDVSASTTYQTMDGFGAAFTDSSTWLTWNKQSARPHRPG
jgi:glucosylceramidase